MKRKIPLNLDFASHELSDRSRSKLQTGWYGTDNVFLRLFYGNEYILK